MSSMRKKKASGVRHEGIESSGPKLEAVSARAPSEPKRSDVVASDVVASEVVASDVVASEVVASDVVASEVVASEVVAGANDETLVATSVETASTTDGGPVVVTEAPIAFDPAAVPESIAPSDPTVIVETAAPVEIGTKGEALESVEVRPSEPVATVEEEPEEIVDGPVNYDEPGLLEVEVEEVLYRFDAGKQGTALCLSKRPPESWRWSFLGELRWDGRDLRSRALDRKLLGKLSVELRSFASSSAE